MKRLPKRGMALITALVLMVMMTSIAIKLFTRLSQQTTLATYQQQVQQAKWYLASAESLALGTLRQSLAKESLVHLAQPWATMTHHFPVPQGTLSATLSDRQTCFNINALANQDPEQQMQAREQLLNLLSLLEIPASQAEALVESVEQVLGVNKQPPSDDDQQHRAGVLLLDISELRAIEGMDAGLYKKIAPFICALPQTRQQININTLNEQQSVIVQALFAPVLSASEAQMLIQQRPTTGWKNVEQFLNASPLAKVDAAIKTQLKGELSVESRYFLLLAEIKFSQVTLVSRSLIFRVAAAHFSILWHQMGEIE